MTILRSCCPAARRRPLYQRKQVGSDESKTHTVTLSWSIGFHRKSQRISNGRVTRTEPVFADATGTEAAHFKPFSAAVRHCDRCNASRWPLEAQVNSRICESTLASAHALPIPHTTITSFRVVFQLRYTSPRASTSIAKSKLSHSFAAAD